MALDVSELVAALPVESEKDDASPPAMHELLSALSHKPVPVGSLTRLWILGTMQAKVAAAYLAYWIRSSYATEDEKQRQLNETHLAAAVKLLGGMSYLRGAVMKVGQLLGAYPRILPAQFLETLTRLHFEAPPMHFALLREHIRNELGGDPTELFAHFETTAFAAASMGQVHRATLKSGERVAVKVQYPNIAATIRSDFRNMSAILAPMRLTRDWQSIRAQFDDIARMLETETDYRREAESLEKARALFADDDPIVIPRVFPELSAGRVLTMQHIDGLHLDDYLKTDPPQAERDRYGSLIMTAGFRLCYTGRIWHTDPSPGNYFFMSDGRLGVIDFGSCREFDDDEWRYVRDSTRAVMRGGEGLRAMLLRGMDAEPDEPINADHLRCAEQYTHWVNECMTCERAFDFGRESYLQRGFDLMTEVARKRYFRSVPVNNWLFRAFVGIRALLFRMGARVDVRAVADAEAVHALDDPTV